ncbi:probable 2-oxoglutarate-dependent dioxygenase ANS [Amborella trichopoda]|nr:probable 2-oxoglutarate-dependent dioxygenase ANS [Amborella trichopoda]|eukprot:XP_020522780.1 probable 2-oxoglutarate-dependent dioxygenase ANS [Amborella trichopoda]
MVVVCNNSMGVGVEWPEPVERVQKLAESGIQHLPQRYIRPPQDRSSSLSLSPTGVPVVDLSAGNSMKVMQSACREWGVFQLVNHGIPDTVLSSAMNASRGFFDLPMSEKQLYANDPLTYEGYGSRVGVQKGILLDWGDYFFHHVRPLSHQKQHKWPANLPHFRRNIDEYCSRVFELCKELLGIFSEDLGLPKGCLVERFGGEEQIGLSCRMNYYPKCPQPELTLGLSPHTDPGGFTVIIQDDNLCGLQVKKDVVWVSVPPIPKALIIILADQLEVLSNGIYTSAEHRATVNKERERMSLVVFCNPDGEMKIGPVEEAVAAGRGKALYEEMSFNQYRQLIRTVGTKGKSFVNSRKGS